MTNMNNDFVKSLKVDDIKQVISTATPSPDRDVYTCLKLMGDTGKIEDFLALMSTSEFCDKKVANGMAINYFHIINAKLGYAEHDYRQGKIDSDEFNKKINEICKNHDLDFNYLMETTSKIDLLQKEKVLDLNKGIKLAQEIEDKAIEEHEKIMNEEKGQ